MKIHDPRPESSRHSGEYPAPNVMAADCPSRRILNHITNRWGGLVLIALQGRTLRFSELRRTISGVSERMLAQTLKTLEADGFVHREAFDVVPPHVEYRLTPLGNDLAARFAELSHWIEANLHRFPSVAAPIDE